MSICSRLLPVGLASLLGALLLAGCSASKTGQIHTSETAFAEAKAKYADGDYFDAEMDLNTMKLQYPGNAHADSVQFLLGGCNYHQGKFLLAAYEFAAIHRSFPSSPLNRAAQFNVAESYYKLAPPSAIDQEYSVKAIEEYQAFIELYGNTPGGGDSLSDQASARIRELRSRLGKKYYDTAVLYANMNQYRASNEYCELVQEKYYDTEYAERGLLLKIHNLIATKKLADASRAIEKFLTIYRSSALVPEVRSLRETIPESVVTKP